MKPLNTTPLILMVALITITSPVFGEWYIECILDIIKNEQVSVFTLPDGSGDPLSNAFQWDGVVGNDPIRVDSTIHLTLMAEEFGQPPYPVFNYPAEDMWLETSLGGLSLCFDGSLADGNTDENGQTNFSQAIFGGGSTDPEAGEMCIVIINGDPCSNPGVDVQFNSPDINGDLFVNLTDVVLFADIYLGDYNYGADFYWDGQIDLSDIVYLALGLGAQCP